MPSAIRHGRHVAYRCWRSSKPGWRITSAKVMKGSLTRKAMEYTLGQWPYLSATASGVICTSAMSWRRTQSARSPWAARRGCSPTARKAPRPVRPATRCWRQPANDLEPSAYINHVLAQIGEADSLENSKPCCLERPAGDQLQKVDSIAAMIREVDRFSGLLTPFPQPGHHRGQRAGPQPAGKNLLFVRFQFVSADAGFQTPQREGWPGGFDWLIAERPGKVKRSSITQEQNDAINIEYMIISIRAKVDTHFASSIAVRLNESQIQGLLKNDNQLAMVIPANLFRADQMIRQWEDLIKNWDPAPQMAKKRSK